MTSTFDSTTLGALALCVVLVVSATAGGAAGPVATDASHSETGVSTAAAVTAAGNTVEVLLDLAETDGDPAANDDVTWVRTDTGDRVEQTTNATGVASANLTAGETYEVTYRQHGESTDFPKDGSPDVYALGTRTYDADATNATTLPAGHNLSVTVQDPAGNPIPNATVHVRHRNDDAYATVAAETNASGVLVDPASDGLGYEVTGDVFVHVQPPDGTDFATNHTQLTVTGDRDLTMVLEPVVNVSGTVQYPNGTAASNVTLRLISDGGGDTDFQQVVTDADGSYAADLLENRSYEVTLWQANLRHVNASTPTNVAYPRDDVADFASLGWLNTSTSNLARNYSFPVGHTLNVTVQNESGVGIENASVGLSQHVNGAHSAFYSYLHRDGMPTDAQGRMYHPPNVAPGLEVNGTVDVTAMPPGNTNYGHNHTEVAVTRDRDVSLVLDGTEESVEVSGTVRYPNGTAASNVTLRMASDDRGDYHGVQVVTDADGSYAVDLQPDRSYEVKLWQANLRKVDSDEPTNVAYPRDDVADFASLGWLNTSTSDLARNYSFPVGHTLNVTVQNESGAGIENVSVGLRNRRNAAEVFVYNYIHERGLPTDAQGRTYHPPNAGPGLEVNGTVEVTAVPPDGTNYDRNGTDVAVSSDREVTLTLTSSDGGGGSDTDNFEGRWVDPDGDPVADVTTYVINWSTKVIESTPTDSDGRFAVSVPNGTYNVYATNGTPGDGVADAWRVYGVSVDGATDAGNLTVPRGYATTLELADRSGDPVDGYVDVEGGNDGWIHTIGHGQALDRPSNYDAGAHDLTNGTHAATVYDSWTHDVLGTGFVTVAGANRTATLSVDRFNGTEVAGALGTTVVRDIQSPQGDRTVEQMLNESINVRLFVLNATDDTRLHVTETLPAEYALNVTSVAAEGSGTIENVTFADRTLSFDVRGDVSAVRYQAVLDEPTPDAVRFTGAFDSAPTVGETAVPADPNVSAFAPADGATVSTANPTVEFVTRHPEAANATDVEYRVDGGAWRDLGGTPAVGSVQLAGLDDGQHTVTVRLVNESGVVVTDTTTFTVDATA